MWCLVSVVKGEEAEMNLQSGVPQLLYVGGFELPDRNAAAQRVLSVARIYADLGYEVCFLNYSPDVLYEKETAVRGFRCFEFPAIGKKRTLYDISAVKKVCEKLPNLRGMIAYNYPAIALWKLRRLCSQKGLLCLGDVTEWYSARGYAPLKREMKALDTFGRMRLMNKRMDGLIVISRYLMDAYSSICPTALIPPLVDKKEEKWHLENARSERSDAIIVGYAGCASQTKERLDVVLESAAKASRGDLQLYLIGLTEQDYQKIYSKSVPAGAHAKFFGRIPHEQTLQIISACDYTVVMRDENRVTKAGFPTKFVESVSMNTPVICNDNSDLAHWVESRGCGIMCNFEELELVFANLERKQVAIADRWIFDYRRYKQAIEAFMNRIEEGNGIRS